MISPSTPPAFSDWAGQQRGRLPAFHGSKGPHDTTGFGTAPADRKSAPRPLAVRSVPARGGLKPYRVVATVAYRSQGDWNLFRCKETGRSGSRMKPQRGRAGLKPSRPLFFDGEERDAPRKHEELSCGAESLPRIPAPHISGRRNCRRLRAGAYTHGPRTLHPRAPPPWATEEGTRRGIGRKGTRNKFGDGADSDTVFKIKQYLRKEHRIPFNQILTECSMLLHANGHKLLGTLKPRRIGRIRGLVHTPDVAVTDCAGGLLFVIEQDGRIHESAGVAARDRLRNGHYAKAGIPCIVLKSSEMRSSRKCMAETLDDGLERLGMRKPAGLHLSFSTARSRSERTGGPDGA